MPTLDVKTAAQLVVMLDRHAPWSPVPLCPSLSAWSAADELPLWHALEAEFGRQVPPPMYGVAWPGSQALARVILDGGVRVAGKRVLDIGWGSGVAATAAAVRGAVTSAADIDPLAVSAAVEHARRHGVSVEAVCRDPLADDAWCAGFDLVMGGDLFYDATGAERGREAVRRWCARGQQVLVADAGRPFFRSDGLREIFSAQVAVPGGVEGVSSRWVRVYGGAN